MSQKTYYTMEEEKKECETTATSSSTSSGGDDNNSFLDKQVLLDRQQKLQMVLECVSKNCKPDSKHRNLRIIYASLERGDRLQGKVIAGGYTNYSYQLYLENNPSIKLFAKACFSYALWCPGEAKKHYDLERQTCEFNLMKKFSEILQNEMNETEETSPVVTPYLLLDVSDEVRILVTQWASADEQWANQFIEGEVDRRILPKIAKTLATIGLTDPGDHDMNSSMVKGLREMMAQFDDVYYNFFDPVRNPNPDECVKYLQLIGKDQFQAIQDQMRTVENQKQCLVHADPHIFNILVEAKPDIENLERFGEKGNFVLCDWEMAHVSCRGLDLALLFSIPLACAYFLAARGFLEKAKDIVDCLDVVWEHYASHIIEVGGKDEAFLIETFRNLIGFCGSRMFGIFYSLGAQVEHIDRGNLTKEEIDTVMSSIGLTGIHFEEAAFLKNSEQATMDLKNLRGWYNSRVQEQLHTLHTEMARRRRASSRRNQTPRRHSSLLRATGRRVSDASLQDFCSLSSLDA